MSQSNFTQRFNPILPALREWIEATLEEHRTNAVPVITFDFPRLKKVFPNELLARAKAVVVTGNVPFPPLARLGLTEFSHLENMPIAGITYKDTFFVNHFHQTESLYFHELVHIVQWDRLGVNDFLLAYGVGLMQLGYEECPFEKMAYSLQESFDNGTLPDNIMGLIQEKTDVIWEEASSLFASS